MSDTKSQHTSTSGMGVDILIQAKRFKHGIGVEIDMEESRRWLEEGKDDAEAQSLLSMHIIRQSGVDLELGINSPSPTKPTPAAIYSEAISLCRKAADQGHPRAMYNLGLALLDDVHGVAKDAALGAEYLLKSANSGERDAMLSIGDCYSKGVGVEQSHEESVKLFQMAAERNVAAAQFNLGNAYNMARGVSQDFKKAIEYWKLAAIQGHAPAQHNVGDALCAGIGIKIDYAEAVKWYRRACSHGLQFSSDKLKELSVSGVDIGGEVPEPIGALTLDPIEHLLGWAVRFPFSESCACCGRPETRKRRLMVCKGCFDAGYCSQDCQKRHWKNHKKECKKAMKELSK